MFDFSSDNAAAFDEAVFVERHISLASQCARISFFNIAEIVTSGYVTLVSFGFRHVIIKISRIHHFLVLGTGSLFAIGSLCLRSLYVE
jgi:hypothetical protein